MITSISFTPDSHALTFFYILVVIIFIRFLLYHVFAHPSALLRRFLLQIIAKMPLILWYATYVPSFFSVEFKLVIIQSIIKEIHQWLQQYESWFHTSETPCEKKRKNARETLNWIFVDLHFPNKCSLMLLTVKGLYATVTLALTCVESNCSTRPRESLMQCEVTAYQRREENMDQLRSTTQEKRLHTNHDPWDKGRGLINNDLRDKGRWTRTKHDHDPYHSFINNKQATDQPWLTRDGISPRANHDSREERSPRSSYNFPKKGWRLEWTITQLKKEEVLDQPRLIREGKVIRSTYDIMWS